MKPAPFEYRRADSVEEALHHLGEFGEEAKLLAGGQSLVPLLSFRLAKPACLVDVNPLTSLDYIERNGALRIGALTRHRRSQGCSGSRRGMSALPDRPAPVGL